jgi:hypothetical protein
MHPNLSTPLIHTRQYANTLVVCIPLALGIKEDLVIQLITFRDSLNVIIHDLAFH